MLAGKPVFVATAAKTTELIKRPRERPASRTTYLVEVGRMFGTCSVQAAGDSTAEAVTTEAHPGFVPDAERCQNGSGVGETSTHGSVIPAQAFAAALFFSAASLPQVAKQDVESVTPCAEVRTWNTKRSKKERAMKRMKGILGVRLVARPSAALKGLPSHSRECKAAISTSVASHRPLWHTPGHEHTASIRRLGQTCCTYVA